MIREGRELIPTAKAFQLMTLLRGLGVEELSKPGAHRRVGVQARADRARQARARRVHAPDRRHDEAHRQEGEGVRPRDGARRLCDARDAVPELRRRRQGELPALHLHRQDRRGSDACGFSFGKTPAGPDVRARRSRAVPARQADRSARRLPLEGRLAVHGGDRAQVQTRRTRTGSSSSTSANDAEETGELVDFSGQEPLGICPEERRPGVRAGPQLRLRARRPNGSAAGADVRLQEPQDHPAAAASNASR